MVPVALKMARRREAVVVYIWSHLHHESVHGRLHFALMTSLLGFGQHRALRVHMSQNASRFFHRSNEEGTFASICQRCFQTIDTRNHEAELAAKEQAHVCYGRGRTARLSFVPPGQTVYQVDICNAIKDHVDCPRFTMLSAGQFELGPLACTCQCHKKPTTQN
jgi:hypothetical protein